MADVLFGDYNPSAKLPMSFPRTEGQIPIYYNHYNTGRPAMNDSDRFYRSAYTDLSLYPKYPFGFGLSYSQFEYSNVSLDKQSMKPGEKLTATVTITNNSTTDGEEVVQLYIRDLVGSVVRPVKELKGFKKLLIKAGQKETVHFSVTVNDLKFYNDKLQYNWEPGEFEVMIGGNSKEVKKAGFSLNR